MVSPQDDRGFIIHNNGGNGEKQMTTEQIRELIKTELKKWNNAQLHTALDFCIRKSAETQNEWWFDLTKTVQAEITDRGGRY